VPTSRYQKAGGLTQIANRLRLSTSTRLTPLQPIYLYRRPYLGECLVSNSHGEHTQVRAAPYRY